MPLPVIAGLPWLAGVLTSAFAGLVVWFAQFFTKRLAVIAAAVAFMAGLTTAMFVAIQSLVGALTLAVPAVVVQGAGFVLPSNLSLCISLIVTARMLRYAYDWNVKFVQLKLF